MTSLSAALMAHPSRKPFVTELVEQLGRDIPVVWDRRNDRWDTGRRSMLAHDPAADWHVVIQDDAVPSRDLLAGIEQACDAASAAGHLGPLAFYVGRLRPTDIQHRAGVLVDQARRTGAAWMEMEGPWWGVAIAVPTSQIADMLAWCDLRDDPANPDYIANYDKRIAHYYASQNIRCWYSVPSLVDHREVGENPSLVPGRTGNRQAHYFIGAERSALDIDWTRSPQEDRMATHRNRKTGSTIDVTPGTKLARAVEKSQDWEPVEARYGIDVPADQAPARPPSDPDTTPDDDPGEKVAEPVATSSDDDPDPADDAPQPVRIDDLDDLSRDSLDTRALEAGVEDPDKLPNKAAVIAAIREKVAEPVA